MSKIRDLSPILVWVSPQHLASTALHILSGHRLRSMAVLDGQRLVGVVHKDDIVGAQPESQVAFVMKQPGFVAQLDDDSRAVADRFVTEAIDSAPVLEGEAYRGMVTATMLLKELGRSFDPLTRLPWSDYLREWGREHLESGEEICVIFIDLNNFGSYNKKFGHIVGDRVLQRVAEYLRSEIDPDTDVLVRYAGDEFAIGSLRKRDDAEALAHRLRDHSKLTVEGADRAVTFAVGIHGGRRSRIREDQHVGATLDNLINIASRNCQTDKEARPEPPQTQGHARYQVISVHADATSERGVTTVVLSYAGAVASGADPRGDKEAAFSVAVATAKALERAIPGSSIQIESVSEDEEQIVTVAVRATLEGTSGTSTASRKTSGDLYTAVAEATIAAIGER